MRVYHGDVSTKDWRSEFKRLICFQNELYKEPLKPSNALKYFQNNFANFKLINLEVQTLKDEKEILLEENEKLKEKIKKLESLLEDEQKTADVAEHKNEDVKEGGKPEKRDESQTGSDVRNDNLSKKTESKKSVAEDSKKKDADPEPQPEVEAPGVPEKDSAEPQKTPGPAFLAEDASDKTKEVEEVGEEKTKAE